MTRKRAHDPRPYIRDAAAFDEPPSAGFVATATIGMVVLALAVGFVIGFAVFLVMNLSTWLTSLLWNGTTGDAPTPWFSLAVCTLGGVLIGVWTWWSNDRVKPLEEVMAEFKATGSHKTNRRFGRPAAFRRHPQAAARAGRPVPMLPGGRRALDGPCGNHRRRPSRALLAANAEGK